MGITIRTVCKASLETVTPELLYNAIEPRLAPLAAIYAPDAEESPRQVLSHLRVERENAKDPFGVWELYYTPDSRCIRLERQVSRAWESDRRALFDEVKEHEDPVASQRIRALLSEARECVIFELSDADARSIGLATALAAAAALAKAGDGLIRVDDEGWLEPKDKVVASVLAFR